MSSKTYSIGLNSSANVMALYYDASFTETSVVANLITNPRMAATIGGIAIAIGALTFSRRVMMTVGTRIAEISQLEGFIVVIAMALTVVLMGNCMGIPVSNSQAIVGAVMGAHGKGSEIVQRPVCCGAKCVAFRFRITGVDLAGENLLGNVVNLHRVPSFLV